MYICPHLNITTFHNYQINYKYKYKCIQCGTIYGRHSKSIHIEKDVCKKCNSFLELLPQLNKDGTPKKPKKLTEFNIFVKENFNEVKKELPYGTPQKEIMNTLSKKWKEFKSF